jgi:hypothetical protein
MITLNDWGQFWFENRNVKHTAGELDERQPQGRSSYPQEQSRQLWTLMKPRFVVGSKMDGCPDLTAECTPGSVRASGRERQVLLRQTHRYLVSDRR